MPEYLTNTEDLTTVANAIRERCETSEPLSFPDGFASAVSAIPHGADVVTGNFTVSTDTTSVTVPALKGKDYFMFISGNDIQPLNQVCNGLKTPQTTYANIIFNPNCIGAVSLSFDSSTGNISTSNNIAKAKYYFAAW